MVLNPLDFEGLTNQLFGTRVIFIAVSFIAIAFMSAKWRFNNITFLMMFALFIVMMSATGAVPFGVSLVVVGAIVGGWLFSKTTKT